MKASKTLLSLLIFFSVLMYGQEGNHDTENSAIHQHLKSGGIIPYLSYIKSTSENKVLFYEYIIKTLESEKDQLEKKLAQLNSIKKGETDSELEARIEKQKLHLQSISDINFSLDTLNREKLKLYDVYKEVATLSNGLNQQLSAGLIIKNRLSYYRKINNAIIQYDGDNTSFKWVNQTVKKIDASFAELSEIEDANKLILKIGPKKSSIFVTLLTSLGINPYTIYSEAQTRKKEKITSITAILDKQLMRNYFELIQQIKPPSKE